MTQHGTAQRGKAWHGTASHAFPCMYNEYMCALEANAERGAFIKARRDEAVCLHTSICLRSHNNDDDNNKHENTNKHMLNINTCSISSAQVGEQKLVAAIVVTAARRDAQQ